MTNPSKDSERRKNPRLSNSIPLKIFLGDGEISTDTVNISRSGAYCIVNQYIEPMTKLNINLMVPVRNNDKFVSKNISCEGVVVRIEKCDNENFHNVAIFFNDIAQKDAENIADYVSSYIEQEDSE